METANRLAKGPGNERLGSGEHTEKEQCWGGENFQSAAPLLKPDEVSYARNQYASDSHFSIFKRIPEAKAAFTDAASVNSPYRTLAQEKLKALPAATAAKKS